MEDYVSIAGDNTAYFHRGFDRSLSEGDRHSSGYMVQNLHSFESSIILHNNGLALMCQAEKEKSIQQQCNLIVSRDVWQNEASLECTLQASDLLRMAGKLLCCKEHMEVSVLRYSLSSTGADALHYWIQNIQLQIATLLNLQILIQESQKMSLHSINISRRACTALQEMDGLNDTFAKIKSIQKIVIGCHRVQVAVASREAHGVDDFTPAA
jgi:hypothetical protein